MEISALYVRAGWPEFLSLSGTLQTPMKQRKRLLKLLIIIAALPIALWGMSLFAGPLIRAKIISTIHKSSKGVYTAQIGGMGFDLSTFTYTLSDFHLHFDSATALKSTAPLLVNLDCPHIRLQGLSLTRTFLTNSFRINMLSSRDTINASFYINKQPEDTTTSKSALKISFFSVHMISIPAIRFKLSDLRTGKPILITKNLSFAGTDLSVDLAGKSAFGMMQMTMDDNHLPGKQDRFVKQLTVKLSEKLFLISLDSVESKRVISAIDQQDENSSAALDYKYDVKKLDIEVNNLFESINALQSNYQGARFYVERIHLYNPVISITDKPDRVVTQESMANKEKVKAFVSPFLFHKIIVENGTVTYTNKAGQVGLRIRKFDCAIDELCLNENHKLIPFDFTSVSCTASGIEIRSGAEYKIRLNELKLDRSAETLTLKGISMMPINKPETYFALAKFRKAYITMDNTDLQCRGFIFSTVDSSFAGCKAVILDHPNLEVLKNQAYEWDKSAKKLLLQELVKQIPINIKIDTLEARNGKIHYKEIGLHGSGEVSLNDVSVKAYHFSTLRTYNAPALKVVFAAKLYDNIPLEATIVYPLNSADGVHTINGTLGSGDMRVFNAYLEKIYGAKIASGQLHSGTFSATYSRTLAVGTLVPVYDDLKMDISHVDLPEKQGGEQKKGMKFLKKVLKTNKESDNAFLQNVTNALANTVVYSSNGKGQSRSGVIQFERRTYKPFLNFWVASLVQGFMDAITPMKVKFE